MYILGISAYYHESSVALIKKNKIVCFVKEEWLTRIKGDNSFPRNAISFLKKKYKLSDYNLDFVCFYEKPFTSWWNLFKYSINRPIKNKEFLINHVKNFSSSSIFFKKDLQKTIQIQPNKIIFSSHHLSHALYALSIVKNKKDFAVISIDGVGEGITSSIFNIKEKEIECIQHTNYPHSLGLFYSVITDFMGFGINEDEYKVMSLASYGKPIFYKKISKIFDKKNFIFSEKYFGFHKRVDQSFSENLIKVLGKPFLSLKNKKNFKQYANIASSTQKILEESINLLVKKTLKETKKKKIIFCGGVALNCKAITNVAKKNKKTLFLVPPSPGDSGSAIGAAVYANYLKQKKLSFFHPSPFIGPDRKSFTDKKLFNLLFERIGNENQSNNLIHKFLSNGQIIATFLAQSEIGPRALGNTSLICDGLNKKSIKELNLKIKNRDFFQPLAPIILEKNFNKFFVKEKNIYNNHKWMGVLALAKNNLYKKIKSVLHVDKTARVQTVDKKYPIYNLLNYLDKKKMKILINTSFNISKDPIVFDINDVYVNMRRLGITYLYCFGKIYKIKNI
jgi:carbamoyltransferase